MNIIENYKISMLGSVGSDIYKDKIINTLNQSRIEPIIKITIGETSRCAAGFYNKKPYLISDIKSSKNLDKEFIISNKDKILNHQILLIEGYYIQNQFEICKELCELFQKEQNKSIILVLNKIDLNQYLDEKFVIISNYSDIIFSSLSQAEEFTNLKGGIEQQKIFEKLFQKLSDNKKKLLVIKDGKDESYCVEYDYTRKRLTYILKCFQQKIKNEEIIDEVGVEDAFFGGFLAGYMKGCSLYTCLKKGNDVANLALKNPGCTFEKKK
jgi:adenosine kinase